MAESRTGDANGYKSITYILNNYLDVNFVGEKREGFFVGIHEKHENSSGWGYQGKNDIAALLARTLLEQGEGRFKYDSVSLVINNVNRNTTPDDVYQALLQNSPSLMIQRGAARINALGEERLFFESIIRETFRILEETLGKEWFHGLAPRASGEFNHHLFPKTSVSAG